MASTSIAKTVCECRPQCLAVGDFFSHSAITEAHGNNQLAFNVGAGLSTMRSRLINFLRRAVARVRLGDGVTKVSTGRC